jgi:hypothetical protein
MGGTQILDVLLKEKIKESKVRWTIVQCLSREFLSCAVNVAKVGKLVNFKHFYIILCTVVYGMFNCQTASLVDVHRLWMKAAWTSSTQASLIGHLLGVFSLLMQQVSSQFIPLVNWHSCSWFYSRHHTKYLLHCNFRPRLVKPQHAFRFFYSRCHFYNCWM